MVVFALIKNRLITNSMWIILEKILSFLGLIFITSFVAKYIGPESFGKLTFVGTIFGIVQSIAMFGTDVIGTKRLSQNHDSGIRVLVSITLLRNVIYFSILIPLLIYMWYSSDTLTGIFSIAIAIATYIALQDIYLLYNDATLKAVYNVLANIIGLAISLFFRFCVPYFELGPEFLAIPIITITLIPFLIRRVIFSKTVNHQITKKIRYKHRVLYSRYVFLAGSSLVVSSIAVAFYVSISQLIIGILDTKTSLGIYSVALTLGATWAFINQAFLTTFTPKLYQSKTNEDAYRNTSLISRIMLIFGFTYFIIFAIFGKYIIIRLYGSQYIAAYSIVLCIIISTILSNLGQVYARFIILKNGYGYLMYKQIVVLLFGVVTGLLLIYLYGIYGAAYNVILIEVFSLTISNYFFKRCEVLRAQLYIFKVKNPVPEKM